MRRIFILTCFIILLAGCGDCGVNSNAASEARALSDVKLLEIYQVIEKFREDGIVVPEEKEINTISNIIGKEVYVTRFTESTFINLKGCSFDDKVSLFVDFREGKIKLSPGEKSKLELLWSKD